MQVFDRFVSCGLAEPMTSLRVLADESRRPAPSDAAVRGAVSRALGAA
jgi:lipoyl(octanoyl) transferase